MGSTCNTCIAYYGRGHVIISGHGHNNFHTTLVFNKSVIRFRCAQVDMVFENMIMMSLLSNEVLVATTQEYMIVHICTIALRYRLS